MKLKVLLLIFILAGTLVSGVNFAYGQETDSQYLSASEFLSQLQINSGMSNDYGKQVTRAEFAALIVRALNASDVSADESVFMDCVGNPYSKEIAIAKEFGITSGTSQGMFSPSGGVTYSAAAKMLVAAVGASDIADNRGGYPLGYMVTANSLNLLDGTASADASVSVGDAYVMIYNALTAPFTSVTGIYGDELMIKTDKTKSMLSEYWNMECISGVAVTVGDYSVRDGYADAMTVEIGDTLLKSDVSGMEKYLGHTVDAWYGKDDETVHALYSSPRNKTVVIDAKDAQSYRDGEFAVYGDNDRTYTYRIERGFTYTVNGRAAIHSDESFAPDAGTVTLVDNDSDGKYEFVKISKKDYFVIRGININDNTIFDSKSQHRSINLDHDSDQIRRLYVDGTPADISALKADMVCEVYMSPDEAVCYVYAGGISVSGKVNEKGEETITVNNIPYKANWYFDANAVVPGETYTLLVAPDGTLTDIDSSASSMQYGYVLGFKSASNSMKPPAIKILTATGEKAEYNLDTGLKVDGVNLSSDDPKLTGIFMNGSVPRYQLIRYKLKDKLLSVVDTHTVNTDNWDVTSSRDNYNSLVMNMEKTDVFYRSDSKFGIPNVPFPMTTVFHVPLDLKNNPNEQYNDDMFAVKGINGLVNDVTYTVDAFDYDENYIPGAVVVYVTSEKGALSTPTSVAVQYMVRKVTDAVDDEGNALKLVKVFANGKYDQFFIDDLAYVNLAANGKVPDEGDVVRFAFDDNNYITGVNIDVDYDKNTHSHKINYGVASIGNNANAYLMYFAGTALAGDGNYLAIRATNAPAGSTNSENVMNLYLSPSVRYVVYDRSEGDVRSGDSSDVATEAQAGESGATLIAVRSTYYTVNTVFAYVD